MKLYLTVLIIMLVLVGVVAAMAAVQYANMERELRRVMFRCNDISGDLESAHNIITRLEDEIRRMKNESAH